MAIPKSEYEKMLEGILAESTEFFLSEERSMEVFEELNKGMEEFLYKEKKIEVESELELTSIILNA